MIDHLLQETVTIQALTFTQSAMGSMVRSTTNRIVSLRANFRMMTTDEEDQQFGKRTNRNKFMMYCSYSTSAATIVATDRVIWGSRTLEVKKPYNATGRDVLFQIECEEID